MGTLRNKKLIPTDAIETSEFARLPDSAAKQQKPTDAYSEDRVSRQFPVVEAIEDGEPDDSVNPG